MENEGKRLDNTKKAVELSKELVNLTEQDKTALKSLSDKIDYSAAAKGLPAISDTVNKHKEELIEKASQPILRISYKLEQLGYKVDAKYIDNDKKSNSDQ